MWVLLTDVRACTTVWVLTTADPTPGSDGLTKKNRSTFSVTTLSVSPSWAVFPVQHPRPLLGYLAPPSPRIGPHDPFLGAVRRQAPKSPPARNTSPEDSQRQPTPRCVTKDGYSTPCFPSLLAQTSETSFGVRKPPTRAGGDHRRDSGIFSGLLRTSISRSSTSGSTCFGCGGPGRDAALGSVLASRTTSPEAGFPPRRANKVGVALLVFSGLVGAARRCVLIALGKRPIGEFVGPVVFSKKHLPAPQA